MWEESTELPKALRSGLTTGSCATACCVAAAEYLLAGQEPPVVSITLPKGKTVDLTIVDYQHLGKSVRAATIKDAGDDPDITHRARIFVELSLKREQGVVFMAAKGVGIVTREGLLLAVGEPAINPVPRKMITDHLQRCANECHYEGGFEVAVGVENGEALALKTMNPRLGILGGLSILGTTGIVRPYSCSAWIASIQQGIDVARANGVKRIAASTGSSSETAIREHYQLPEIALIEMGDFVGAVLKHLKKTQIKKLSICGGFGKISKLAMGCMDLHSRVSHIDFDFLATQASALGASDALIKKVQGANTSAEVLKDCQQAGLDIGAVLCEKARDVAQAKVPDNVEVEVWAISRQGDFVGHAEYPQGGKK